MVCAPVHCAEDDSLKEAFLLMVRNSTDTPDALIDAKGFKRRKSARHETTDAFVNYVPRC